MRPWLFVRVFRLGFALGLGLIFLVRPEHDLAVEGHGLQQQIRAFAIFVREADPEI